MWAGTPDTAAPLVSKMFLLLFCIVGECGDPLICTNFTFHVFDQAHHPEHILIYNGGLAEFNEVAETLSNAPNVSFMAVLEENSQNSENGFDQVTYLINCHPIN